ncbi:hypothetical protein [Piscinibacter koreensis]|uniref:Amino acid transporter n=1 Tax=Piscinibacter koreensis TaxID=2742824 RepID=A0A7Y6NJD4_9BURK|nr:hypothetical protein [Schlegelella koreensis]NUZ04270.1 hypothetical protein [Schlegelella koreensis]
MDPIDLLQWPAMLVTVLAAYLVASSEERRRRQGFWVFLLSNVLWIVWGWHTSAHALIVLQLALAVMNIRGARKARRKARAGEAAARASAGAEPVASET